MRRTMPGFAEGALANIPRTGTFVHVHGASILALECAESWGKNGGTKKEIDNLVASARSQCGGPFIAKPTAFAVLTFNIVFRPVWTSANLILDGGPAGLPRAITYFLEAFALTFAILLIANRFQLYEGTSEWRELTVTIAQFLVAIIFIYALCLTLPDRIPFFRLVQGALYTVGAYLLAASLAAIPVSYLVLTLTMPATGRELDVLATEYQRCLAGNSILYWLFNGEFKFYLSSKPQDWENWFLENYYYLLAIPFVFIFALMLRPVRKISFVLIGIVTAITFVVVDQGISWARQQFSSLLAPRDKCTNEFLVQVTNKYAPDLVARQIAYKIDNVSQKDDILFSSLAVHGTNLVLQVKLKPDVNTPQLASDTPLLIWRHYYCSDDLYLLALRRINYNLLVAMYDNDGTLLQQQQFTPKDCPASPTDAASR
jgi:hypothetical protein